MLGVLEFLLFYPQIYDRGNMDRSRK